MNGFRSFNSWSADIYLRLWWSEFDLSPESRKRNLKYSVLLFLGLSAISRAFYRDLLLLSRQLCVGTAS